MMVVQPGGTIGILGGGQLGMLLAEAARELGFKTHIYCPEEDSPAFLVSDNHTVAAYEDETALAAFAAAVDVVTYEFENVPARTAEIISEHTILRPGANALATSQDRLVEKDFLSNNGIAVAQYMAFNDKAGLREALKIIGLPAVAKTRRFGYDGKGQLMLHSRADVAEAMEVMNGAEAILEGFVPFTKEVSVIIARAVDGSLEVFPMAENVHTNHILDTSTVPAAVKENVRATARVMAGKIITALDYIGVLTIEMFVVEETGEVIVNEIAPRVHNSGHWSIEGAKTSQFAQHIRAICGMELGSTDIYGLSIMKNLLGEEILDTAKYAEDDEATVHDYRKKDPRPGRKMGHVTWVFPGKKHDTL